MNDELLNLLFRVVTVGRQAHTAMDGLLGDLNMTPSKLLILKEMRDESPRSLGEVAEFAVCAKSNVTQLVDSLESNGFVKRFADPHDRRTTLLETTDEGKDKFETAAEALAPVMDCLSTLTAAERTQLFSLLERVSSALK